MNIPTDLKLALSDMIREANTNHVKHLDIDIPGFNDDVVGISRTTDEIIIKLDMTEHDKAVIERYKAEQAQNQFAHEFDIEFETMCRVRFNVDEDGPCDIDIEALGRFNDEDYTQAREYCMERIDTIRRNEAIDRAEYLYEQERRVA